MEHTVNPRQLNVSKVQATKEDSLGEVSLLTKQILKFDKNDCIGLERMHGAGY